MTDLILDSLQRRMAAMHSLYYQAVDTMDLEHVNHFEREGVLPIAFSLFHYTNMEDSSFMGKRMGQTLILGRRSLVFLVPPGRIELPHTV